MKYNVYRKFYKMAKPELYTWSVLQGEPQDSDRVSFELVGDIDRKEDEGRVALQQRVKEEFGDPFPTGEVSEAMIGILASLLEGKDDYQVYHRSYTSAIQELERYAEARGYELDDEEMFDTIGSGPRKPQDGDTNKFTLTLYKDGKPQRKALHAQVYGRGEEGYELNMYIM